MFDDVLLAQSAVDRFKGDPAWPHDPATWHMLLSHVAGFMIAASHPIAPSKAPYAAGLLPGSRPEPAAVAWSRTF
ncbi:hypothetical protein WME97_22025 [Sorangium sp. So ce367]|uniref:hypothetical protein n=1 Tax=Sorangium sp. So ce367 TaxID=3133305 RepID=UPI003F5EA47D